MSKGLIPATILTGFLGSGKTTLLKRVLSEAHGQKIAVIENEFGSENIDNEILVRDSREQIIQLNNGCVCCSIREDLRTTLSDLAEKKRKGELDFERVVIETTGLADPGPVAQTFFMDDEIAESYLLDSILTLVLVSSPLMLVGLVVGVVISLFQALTQIQEMTLVFVPKILAIFVAMLLMLPWMADSLQGHMARTAARIINGG